MITANEISCEFCGDTRKRFETDNARANFIEALNNYWNKQ